MSDELRRAVAQLTKFCDEYAQLSGLDPEVVYGLHRGHPRQCEVRISDLRALIAAATRAASTEIEEEFRKHDIAGGSWFATDDGLDDGDVAECSCGAPLVGRVPEAFKSHLARTASVIVSRSG